ncbi:glycosyltransferase family 2 protein [Candidatus Parcubacteria bacterium]|nr:glycosyltransferase family 2 protein [Candidatus Parcubacteria bacterium]
MNKLVSASCFLLSVISKMHLSVIVPAYNEANTIEKNLNIYNDYLIKQPYDYELILVNDGSLDKTLAIVNDLKKKIENLMIINQPSNQGKGAAVRAGLLAARGEYRLFLDADNATPIEHLDAVWPQIERGADMVIGSRHPRDAAETKIIVPQVLWKRFLGKAGNLLFQSMAVRGIWDTQCGFKIMRAELAKKLLPLCQCRRWALDAELLMLARQANYNIVAIPVKWSNSKESRVGFVGYFITLAELIGIKWRILTKRLF